MVHNGNKYGVMATYAEGLNILRHANAGKQRRTVDADTAPRQFHRFVLLDLTAMLLLDSPDLAKFAGRVSDTREGRWTITAVLDESVPAPVLIDAPYERSSSCGADDFADNMLSALRYQFGGHEKKPATKNGGP